MQQKYIALLFPYSLLDRGQLIYQTERPANDSTKVAAYRLRAQYRLASELRQLLVQAATK